MCTSWLIRTKKSQMPQEILKYNTLVARNIYILQGGRYFEPESHKYVDVQDNFDNISCSKHIGCYPRDYMHTDRRTKIISGQRCNYHDLVTPTSAEIYWYTRSGGKSSSGTGCSGTPSSTRPPTPQWMPLTSTAAAGWRPWRATASRSRATQQTFLR